MRPTLYGTHSKFDQPEYWEFTRNSKLAHGTFDKGIDSRVVAWALTIVAGLLMGLLAIRIGNYF